MPQFITAFVTAKNDSAFYEFSTQTEQGDHRKLTFNRY